LADASRPERSSSAFRPPRPMRERDPIRWNRNTRKALSFPFRFSWNNLKQHFGPDAHYQGEISVIDFSCE